MKIKKLYILASIALLNAAYVPLKAAIQKINHPKNISNIYIHGSDFQLNESLVDLEELEKGLIKMHQEAIAKSHRENIILTYWLRKGHIKLQESDIDCIMRYAYCRKPVYFFIGPTGAGKSTSIFALQGNEVKRKKPNKGRRRKRRLKVTEEGSKGIFECTSFSKNTPTIGHDVTGETVGAIIYDPIDSKYNMAFCDTEGLLGERDKMSEADKCLSAFAPFFALKANKIGGIVLVISAKDLDGTRAKNFKASAQFMRQYFSAVIDQEIRKSVFVMITKVKDEEDENQAINMLAKTIQRSYKHYYEALKKGELGKQKNKDGQSQEEKESNLAELKPFFDLLLENEVSESEQDNLDNFEFDIKRCVFMYPEDRKCIKDILLMLNKLQPLDHKYLCKFDNPLSQYLRKQIIEIGRKLDGDVQETLSVMQKAEIKALFAQEDKNNKKLADIIIYLKQRIEDLKNQNLQIFEDGSLEAVYQDNHIETINRKTSIKNAARSVPKIVIQGAKIGATAGAAAGMGVGTVAGAVAGLGTGIVTGAVTGVCTGKGKWAKNVGVAVGTVTTGLGIIGGVAIGIVAATVGAVGGAALGGLTGIGGILGGATFGYCSKTFTYKGKDPIYAIKATYENADLRFIVLGSDGIIISDEDVLSSRSSFLADLGEFSVLNQHFNMRYTGKRKIDMTLTAKERGISQPLWSFIHVTNYRCNANCHFTMYAKRNRLWASKKLEQHNDLRIQRMEESMDIASDPGKYDTQQWGVKYRTDQESLKGIRSALIQNKVPTIEMLNCWKNHIFRQNTTYVCLLENYLHDFKKATGYQLDICPTMESISEKPSFLEESNFDDEKIDNEESDDDDDDIGPGFHTIGQ